VELYQIQKTWETQEEMTESIAMMKDSHVPGDWQFDPLQLMPAGVEDWNNLNKEARMSSEFEEKRDKELNNGRRLAMIGVTGMLLQELVDHRTLLEHYNEFGFGAAKAAISLLR
jgi:hypothetical protein